MTGGCKIDIHDYWGVYFSTVAKNAPRSTSHHRDDGLFKSLLLHRRTLQLLIVNADMIETSLLQPLFKLFYNFSKFCSTTVFENDYKFSHFTALVVKRA